MKKASILGFAQIILIMVLGGTVLPDDTVTISGQVQSLAAGDPSISGATVQAWNQGNWIDSETTSDDTGAFVLNGLGAGPGYQIFAWLDNTFIDLATAFFHIQDDYSDLMLELMPKTMWDEKLGQYDATSGYLLGTVMGGQDSPVEGAVVLVYDSKDQPLANDAFTIRYFDRNFTLNPALSSTSSIGMFLITLPNASLNEFSTDPLVTYPHAQYKDLKITAGKEGWTFPPLNVAPWARVFPFNDSTRSGIATVAEVSGSENPVIPEEDDKDKDEGDDGGGGGGGGCFISTARC